MAKKLGDNTPTENFQQLQSTLLALADKQQISASQLMERLNCSRQTVFRNLEKMKKSPYGKLVVNKKGHEFMFSFARASRLPKVALTKKGVEDMKMARDFMADILPQSFREETDAMLVNVQAYLPEKERADFTPVGETFRKGKIDYSRFEPQRRVVEACIRDENVCQITYRKTLDSEPRQYDIAPLRIVAYRDAHYVRAWVVTDRGGVRAVHDKPTLFALQRIQEAHATRLSSENLPDEPWSQGFGFVDAEPMQVCIRFSPVVATYVSERQWSSDQKLESQEDGSLTLRMTSTSKRELVSWVLGFGKEATLLEPAPLRQEMAEEMRQMLGRYGE